MNAALALIKESIETAEARAKAQVPMPDIPYGVEWEFAHAMRIAAEAGYLSAAAKQAVAYAELRDEQIASLGVKVRALEAENRSLNETIEELESQDGLAKGQSYEDHLYEQERERRMGVL